MNKSQANAFIARAGFPGLSVHKAEGVWYLIGDEGVIDQYAERCLHVVRLSDLSGDVLTGKIEELTKQLTYTNDPNREATMEAARKLRDLGDTPEAHAAAGDFPIYCD